MSAIEDFKNLLEQIDSILDRYKPGELAPDRIVKEIFEERSRQRPLLEEAVNLATQGLNRFTFNPELLRRRAWARSRIVTPDGSYPEISLAEQDLRTILAFDPNNLRAGAELLEDMFTFSGMENSDVAEVAGELGERTAILLQQYLALQIRAHAHADEHTKAEEVYNSARKQFPESQILHDAKNDADSMKPVQEPPNA